MKKYNIPALIRAIRLMGRRKYVFLGAVFFFCGMEVFGAVLSTTGLQRIVNGTGNGDTALFLSGLFRTIFGIVLWEIYAPLCQYLRELSAAGTMRDVKTGLCEHILKLPAGYHDQTASGEVLSSLTNDCACLERIYTNTFCEVCRYAIDGIGGVVIMAVIDWRFAIVVFSLGLISVRISSYFSSRLEENGTQEQKQLAKTSAGAYELIQAAKTIRLFRLQKKKQLEMEESARSEAEIKVKGAGISAAMNSAITAVNSGVYVALLLVGALFVRFGFSDWGTVIALMSLKGIADMLFVYCLEYLADMQKDLAGAKRLFAILDREEEEVSDCFKIEEMDCCETMRNGCCETMGNACCETGDSEVPISLRNVSFSYEEGKPVLSNFSMEIRDRSLTVLAGESGSGKSTVMKILLAFYAPSAGEVIFRRKMKHRKEQSGMPDCSREQVGQRFGDLAGETGAHGAQTAPHTEPPVTLKQLRQMTAYVPQDAMLSGGNVRENIAGGNPSLPDEAVRKAAGLAGADEFIRSMPDGYDSLLADSGKNLSGGQRQRIAIARALAKDAPVLLLDEVTSALDPETAEQITETIRKISREKAVLWISHDDKAEKIADYVYRL